MGNQQSNESQLVCFSFAEWEWHNFTLCEIVKFQNDVFFFSPLFGLN